MKSIKESLIDSEYQLMSKASVWKRADYCSISYSDGDEVENRILQVILASEDLDSLSDELEVHCVDWPSTYHLSKRRGNLLRPFVQSLEGKKVLEIGAGMGAITRVLGESGAEVLALEGTLRRAEAARARTRDLENVEVLAENFKDFKTNLKFDLITLVGVLEYANLYIGAANSHLNLLKLCHEMLTPGGSLLLAIENKLGLKYFAGSQEDHVGIPMFGLENLYTSNSVRTFGKSELDNLLSLAGFKQRTFHSPLPDYKLTTSIIFENGFKDDLFNSIDLTRDSFGSDLQLPSTLAFNPELVLNTLEDNGLSLDLANSFLVVAGKGQQTLIPQSELAWHFSTSRRKEFCTKTIFRRSIAGEIKVFKSKMSGAPASGQVIHDFPESSTYLEGRLFRDDLELLLAKSSWQHADLRILLISYRAFLLRFKSNVGRYTSEILLFEDSIDLIPRNIVIGAQNNWESFDSEWKAEATVDLRHVLLRAVLSLQSISIFGEDEFGVLHSYKSLFELFCQLLELEINESATSSFLSMEANFQAEVTGRKAGFQDLVNFFTRPMGRLRFRPYSMLPVSPERDSAVAERDSVLNSTIWMLFKPYRKLRNIFLR